LLVFIAGIIFNGVYPKPMLDRINPAVDKLITHVEERSDYSRPEPVVYEMKDTGHGDDAEHGDDHSTSGDDHSDHSTGGEK
jgi:NADH-quinone oxidoreductase subunit M